MLNAKVTKLLREMVEREASDLYVKVGSPPCFRIYGRLVPLDGETLEPEEVTAYVGSILSEEQKERFALSHEVDLAVTVADLGRFRANIYSQRGNCSIVFRAIKAEIPSFETLGLPTKVLQDLCHELRGLILVTGTTGSGKSTTIGSMLDYINTNLERHILTVEDPIEFVHKDKKSIVSQREVGSDTSSYHGALHHIMRQTPDIIYIGDIRDLETMSSAIGAAETGQLVIAPMHSINAPQAVERIINFFPTHQHHEVRVQLALLLKGILSIRLIPRKDGQGRVPACEVMLSTPTIRGLIHEGDTLQIPHFIQEGKVFGMQGFNQAIFAL
jgi:twitching motility protein PilT